MARLFASACAALALLAPVVAAACPAQASACGPSDTSLYLVALGAGLLAGVGSDLFRRG